MLIFCSAAITNDGCLYTWGRGNYGRLGHGKSNDCFVPTVVSTLKGVHVSKVSCGSGDSHTLCVTVDGKVYSWGDGDYGKLGKYLFLRIFKIFWIIYFCLNIFQTYNHFCYTFLQIVFKKFWMPRIFKVLHFSELFLMLFLESFTELKDYFFKFSVFFFVIDNTSLKTIFRLVVCTFLERFPDCLFEKDFENLLKYIGCRFLIRKMEISEHF